MKYDLISIGEPLMRFSPPRYQRIEHADGFDVRIVGSQLNVAADLAALGAKTAFLTQLPDNLLGELAMNKIHAYGVDTSKILRLNDSRLGATFVEFSAAPRSPRAVYDRKDSASSLICADSYDWDDIAAQTEMLYTDGIFPGLSEGCRQATLKFFEAGHRQNRTICFDANFRSHLWTPAEARTCWEQFLPLVDVAVINRSVCEDVFGMQGDDIAMANQFAMQFNIGLVAFTARSGEGMDHGKWQAILRAPQGTFCEGAIEFDIVDRYGTGDAWFAGLLAGLKRHPHDEARALAFANAVIALAHTTFCDVIECTAEEAEALAGGESTRLKR